ncbi:CPXCG motif-containing cysteine-rich protein [Chlorobium sp. N1]|uniref:CPXCG motif-containing cysteine-rich protein n=1 Tax=Chlorobium sp. N1 TaxID=2491138 RepID=UPI00103DB71B|nr:CPXCG motif-containing cysteine-rich protein [Chlorobium sp. N1]TCD48530.1 CPXCG motif-containing cysteine-rich protein [Chlorobium sp. N1]
MNFLESVVVQCPYCGEPMELDIDCAAGRQEYTEDCPVCCKPVTVSVTLKEDGRPQVEVRPEDA